MQHKGHSDWPFSIRIDLFIQTHLFALFCKIALMYCYVTYACNTARLPTYVKRHRGLRASLRWYYCTSCWRGGPASKPALDIYPSSVNNQGAEGRGCILWWRFSHYVIDSLNHQRSRRKPNEIATKHVCKLAKLVQWHAFAKTLWLGSV